MNREPVAFNYRSYIIYLEPLATTIEGASPHAWSAWVLNPPVTLYPRPISLDTAQALLARIRNAPGSDVFVEYIQDVTYTDALIRAQAVIDNLLP